MYKFLWLKNGEIVSELGTQVWQVGKKYSVKGKIQCCHNGFHASDTPLDAYHFVQGEVLAIVEGGGDCDKATNKSAWRHMTLTRAYRWQKADSVALAIYCAEKVIGIFEAKYPNDKRPRNAIDAAKKWLAEPTTKNRIAAASAADAAASAARATACAAARAAARAAASAAADAAAYATASAAADAAADAAACVAAYVAAYAAADAACAAAYATAYAARDDINEWIIAHIAELEEIK